MIDVGFGSCHLPPVPFDFEHESPAYSVYHFKVKYVREEEGSYVRQDFRKRKSPDGSTTEEFKDVIYFDLTPRTLDEIKDMIGKEIYKKNNSLFNACRKMNQINKDSGELIIVNDSKVTICHLDGTETKIVCDSLDEIVAAFAKYFPNFPKDIVIASYNEWYRHDKFIDSV